MELIDWAGVPACGSWLFFSFTVAFHMQLIHVPYMCKSCIIYASKCGVLSLRFSVSMCQKKSINIFISPDESRGYTGFSIVAPPALPALPE